MQDKNFISYKIQSNKGLFIGRIKSIFNNILLIDGSYKFSQNDSFKVIRNGFEVGSAVATFLNDKLIIKYKGDVKVGDHLNLTKKNLLLQELNIENKLKDIVVEIYLKVGEKIRLKCGDVLIESDFIVEQGKTSFLTKEEVVSNLNKTDKYPFKVSVKFIEFSNNSFVPKSLFNALRSSFYEKLFYIKTTIINDNIEKYATYSIFNNFDKKGNGAVITDKFIKTDKSDIIYSPINYLSIDTDVIQKYKDKRVWLYLPPFASQKDLDIISKYVNLFYGVYGEGYYALEYSQFINKPFFAGTGFNLFNKVSVNVLKGEKVEFLSLSKELSFSEIQSIASGVYLLSTGKLQIMDLIYCTFSKNCNNCPYFENVILKDNENREFLLYRYKMSSCRFKVFNNNDLYFNISDDYLEINDYLSYNFSEIDNLQNCLDKKKVLKNYTYGNYKKGILWLKIKL